MAKQKTRRVEVESGVPLDKRTYLPGVVLRSKCPKCGDVAERDLGEDYLSYPTTGDAEDVTFYCERGFDDDGEGAEECGAEWVGARVTVRLVADVETVLS